MCPRVQAMILTGNASKLKSISATCRSFTVTANQGRVKNRERGRSKKKTKAVGVAK